MSDSSLPTSLPNGLLNLPTNSHYWFLLFGLGVLFFFFGPLDWLDRMTGSSDCMWQIIFVPIIIGGTLIALFFFHKWNLKIKILLVITSLIVLIFLIWDSSVCYSNETNPTVATYNTNQHYQSNIDSVNVEYDDSYTMASNGRNFVQVKQIPPAVIKNFYHYQIVIDTLVQRNINYTISVYERKEKKGIQTLNNYFILFPPINPPPPPKTLTLKWIKKISSKLKKLRKAFNKVFLRKDSKAKRRKLDKLERKIAETTANLVKADFDLSLKGTEDNQWISQFASIDDFEKYTNFRKSTEEQNIRHIAGNANPNFQEILNKKHHHIDSLGSLIKTLLSQTGNEKLTSCYDKLAIKDSLIHNLSNRENLFKSEIARYQAVIRDANQHIRELEYSTTSSSSRINNHDLSQNRMPCVPEIFRILHIKNPKNRNEPILVMGELSKKSLTKKSEIEVHWRIKDNCLPTDRVTLIIYDYSGHKIFQRDRVANNNLTRVFIPNDSRFDSLGDYTFQLMSDEGKILAKESIRLVR